MARATPVGLAFSVVRDAHANTFPTHRVHNGPGWWMERVVHGEFVARCTRCDQPVREDQSHVMVVPVGRGRMFFHAGCWSVRDVRDDDEVEQERKTSRPSARDAKH